MMDYGRKTRGNGLLIRALIANLSGMSPDEFAEIEVRRMQCEWCRSGWPLSNGEHDLMGIKMPCEATASRPTAAAAVKLLEKERRNNMNPYLNLSFWRIWLNFGWYAGEDFRLFNLALFEVFTDSHDKVDQVTFLNLQITKVLLSFGLRLWGK